MDIPTLLFILVGLGLLLIPLTFTHTLFYGTTDMPTTPTYYSLIVPGFGLVLLVIGLLAYHKKDIQHLFLQVCQDIEQTGMGRGIGNTLAEAFRPMISSQEANITPLSATSL